MIGWRLPKVPLGALVTAVLASFARPDAILADPVYKIRAGIGYHNCVVKVGCIGQGVNWLSWADIARTSGHNVVFEAKDPAKPGELDLLNRFVFLYSCDCGVGASPLGAFHLGGANTALFGFNDSVFSTLAAGNTQDNLAYNDGDGDLVMKYKLSGHVIVLLTALATGRKPQFALDDANSAHPPRAFSYGAEGINYTPVLNMLRAGDVDATLKTIYRASSETEAHWLQLGDWGLVGKALMPMPIAP